MFVNLTPHAITLFTVTGESITIPPSGTVARVEQHALLQKTHLGVRIVSSYFGDVIDLPPSRRESDYPGAPTSQPVYYIVSAMVRMACPDRHDLVSPGDLKRNEKGEVIGANSLIYNPES